MGQTQSFNEKLERRIHQAEDVKLTFRVLVAFNSLRLSSGQELIGTS
jgi:hypothetical protein